MKKIGLLSDTHNWWDEKYETYFEECDEIWHAGDIGSLEIIDRLTEIKPVRAVYGNIDGQDIRCKLKRTEQFEIEDIKTVMTHIGGYPGRYQSDIKPILKEYKPKLFISGHSHILKVMYDKQLELLHINPGAAGKYGFHKVRTLVRFSLDKGNIKDLEVVELNK